MEDAYQLFLCCFLLTIHSLKYLAIYYILGLILGNEDTAVNNRVFLQKAYPLVEEITYKGLSFNTTSSEISLITLSKTAFFLRAVTVMLCHIIVFFS